jgi:polo-like kinase 1
MVWDCCRGVVEYISRSREEGRPQESRASFHMQEPPEALTKKITLIKYFKCYLQKAKGRKEGVEVVVCNDKVAGAPDDAVHNSDGLVYVKRWLKTKHAIIFRLSNKSVQVSFFDKTEIILSSEERIVSYTDQSGQRIMFSLQSLVRPPPDIAKRLKYTKDILFQLIHR